MNDTKIAKTTYFTIALLIIIVVLLLVIVLLVSYSGGGGSSSGTSISDATPPTISSTSPANIATGVAVDAAITATFSEPMASSTVNTATFTLNNDETGETTSSTTATSTLNNDVTGAVTYSGTTAAFTPSSKLAYSTIYTATITSGVKDAAGNAMVSNHTWIFKTADPAPSAPSAAGTAPSPPAKVTAAAAGSGQVRVSWNAVSGAASYNLYMASVSGVTKNNYSTLADGMQHTDVTSRYTHTGLTNGKTYYFVVTAVNEYGEGGKSGQAKATPHGLNDTGVTASQCYQTGSDRLLACNSAGALALNNAQDGMAGRDVIAATNGSTDGNLGFNFTSVPGGCVQDNVTGLMWEVKTTGGGLRDWTKTYTNYSATYNPSKLYGNAKDASGFVAAVNAAKLCGYSDWRLPTADELQSIVDYSVAYPGPTIVAAWFPNTQRNWYWSASPYVGGSISAWSVSFKDGNVGGDVDRNSPKYVRLVRTGP